MSAVWDKEKEVSKMIEIMLVSFRGIETLNKELQIKITKKERKMNLSALPISLSSHCSLLLDELIYCIGGRIENNENKVEISDTVWQLSSKEPDLKWNEVSSMDGRR